MTIYAKLEGEKVVAVFGAQQDPEVWGELIEIATDDPRYLDFVRPVPPLQEVDPVDKLKAFLADNPDVVGILK
jgi:hypothetical protein